jgi:hypothetical protein
VFSPRKLEAPPPAGRFLDGSLRSWLNGEVTADPSPPRGTSPRARPWLWGALVAAVVLIAVPYVRSAQVIRHAWRAGLAAQDAGDLAGARLHLQAAVLVDLPLSMPRRAIGVKWAEIGAPVRGPSPIIDRAPRAGLAGLGSLAFVSSAFAAALWAARGRPRVWGTATFIAAAIAAVALGAA